MKDNSYYIGFSADVDKRLIEHNFGNTRYTKLKRPWKLIYKEEFKTRGEAITKEKYYKKLKNTRYLEKIMGVGP